MSVGKTLGNAGEEDGGAEKRESSYSSSSDNTNDAK